LKEKTKKNKKLLKNEQETTLGETFDLKLRQKIQVETRNEFWMKKWEA
jgi:hypothetical protein